MPANEKIVLITGGAKRVGAATCRMLHARGARLMVHYRSSQAEAQALADELNQLRADSCALVQGDLLHIEHLPLLVEATLKQYGRLDVLVNNASSFYPTEVGQITAENWDDLIGTNQSAVVPGASGSRCFAPCAWLYREHCRYPRRTPA